MMPYDLEAELSVLAEINEPLHHDLSWVTAKHFYDRRHQRLFRHIIGDALRVPPTEEDLAYLANLTKYAWPITQSCLERFLDCAERRDRLEAIEAERQELMT